MFNKLANKLSQAATDKLSVAQDKLSQAARKVHLAERPIEINGKRLQFEKLLAEGGFSYVYLVRDMETGEEFALKRLLCQDRDSFVKAQAEIDLMRSLLPHDYIVKMYGSKVQESGSAKEVFILMEMATGGSALQLMNERLPSRFSESEVLRIFTDVCYSVAHLHAREPPIIHRDLKVENVLLCRDGHYKLCDFGSATTHVYTLSNQREIVEAEHDIERNTTMAYRAPEMIDFYSGYTITEKADVWALGCILYKLAFFIGPFEESGNLQILNGKYRIPEDAHNSYSEALIELIRFMLVIDPSQRPDVFEVTRRVCEMRGIPFTLQKPARYENAQYGTSTSAAGSTPSKSRAAQRQPAPSPARPIARRQPATQQRQQAGTGALFAMLDAADNKPQQQNSDWADFSAFEASPPQQLTPPQQQQQPMNVPQQRPAPVISISNSNAVSADEFFTDDDFGSPSNAATSPVRTHSPRPMNVTVSTPTARTTAVGSPKLPSSALNQSTASSLHRRTVSANALASAGNQMLDFSDNSTSSSGFSPMSPMNSLANSPSPSELSHFLDSRSNVGTFDMSNLREATPTNKKHVWVVKATSRTNSQPKPKYVNRILLEAWRTRKVQDVFMYFRGRPLFGNHIVCFKVLTIVNILLQQGPPQILRQLLERVSVMNDIRDAWRTSSNHDPKFAQLLDCYAAYLTSRLRFLYKHSAFEGNFSLDNYLSTTPESTVNAAVGSESPFSVACATEMLDIATDLLRVQRLILADATHVCKSAALVPLYYDAADLLRAASFTISKMISGGSLQESDITALTTKFSKVFTELQRFHATVSKIKTVAEALVPVNLPSEVPTLPATNEDGSLVAGPMSSIPPENLSRSIGSQDQLQIQFANAANEDSDLEQEEEVDMDSFYMDPPQSLPEATSSNVAIEQVIRIPGNEVCADCQTPGPRYASVNLGIFICQQCAGFHRGLGVHQSKVKSLTDKWSPELVHYMRSIGNTKANQYWEGNKLMLSSFRRPSATNTAELSKFITDKYYRKCYAKPIKRERATLKSAGHSRTTSSSSLSSLQSNASEPQLGLGAFVPAIYTALNSGTAQQSTAAIPKSTSQSLVFDDDFGNDALSPTAVLTPTSPNSTGSPAAAAANSFSLNGPTFPTQ